MLFVVWRLLCVVYCVSVFVAGFEVCVVVAVHCVPPLAGCGSLCVACCLLLLYVLKLRSCRCVFIIAYCLMRFVVCLFCCYVCAVLAFRASRF